MRYLLFSLIVLVMISCSRKSDDFQYPAPVQGIEGKWELFSSTSVWGNPTKSMDSDLPWQESYIFKNDSTFMKIRNQDGRINEVFGRYFEEQRNSEGLFFRLEYESDNDIIHSCSGLTEFIELKTKYLSNSSWAPCDGPILDYVFVD